MKKFLILILLSTFLMAMSEDTKVLILTKHLIEQGYSQDEASEKALASIYGKPLFKNLIYDENSEMFFGKLTTSKGNLEKDISFFMPKQRAYALLKDQTLANIKIHYHIKNNKIIFDGVDVTYKQIEYPARLFDKPTIVLKIGGYFVSKQNTDISAVKNGIGGYINLEDLLGLEEKTNTLRLDLMYRFNEKHKIYFSYYKIKNSNSRKVTKDFDFNGDTIKAGSDTSLVFDTTIYKLVYEYSAYTTNKLDLLFRAGIHTTMVKMDLNSKLTLHDNTEVFTKESVNVPLPLPVFGVGIEYDITKNVSIAYNMDYFYLSFDGTSGSMTDTTLTIDYKYNKYLGLGIGLNATKMSAETQDGATELKANHDVAGVLGYITLSY